MVNKAFTSVTFVVIYYHYAVLQGKNKGIYIKGIIYTGVYKTYTLSKTALSFWLNFIVGVYFAT